ncbi:hypothetical protein D9611_000635 [Ephemerocybe angulata]|uniref:F-box domain-containing protein n=1 Tax=Ephemerocybe angulata TaxID=980116 RepID=A0A8H5BNG7_9AGAR|nr:hypothetical protein D9611_000635 [Tulosesus angulatus]
MSTASPSHSQDPSIETVQLEEEDVALRLIDRNTLSPITQLPAELLTRIFYLSLQFVEADGLTRTSTRHWRNLVLESPQLWSEVHIRNDTRVEYLDLVCKNSKAIPLHVEVFDMDYSSRVDRVRHILRTEMERLSSVSLHAPIYILRSLLPDLKACSNTIEFLDLVVTLTGLWHVSPATAGDTLPDFPKLRHLRLHHWHTLFITPTFHPPFLARMEIFSHVPEKPVTVALFTALRNVASTL